MDANHLSYKKYNFFDIYISDSIYTYFDRMYLSLFLSEFLKSKL